MKNYNCIKCGKIYESEDDDAYYCDTCLKSKNKIAQEIDKKFTNMDRTPTESSYQKYVRLSKGKGTPFVHIKDL